MIEHLAKLVSFDTRNPPRNPAGIRALFAYVRPILVEAGFQVDERDLGDGCLWLHARRGDAPVLVNIHVDTVPADPGWTRDPFALEVAPHPGATSRAVGLGACDIKGALAAVLTAVSSTNGPAEVLLTSDEEAGQSRCVRTFVAEHDVKGRAVVVCEPTRLQAVVAHRGIGSCTGAFSGIGGHASSGRAYDDSAVHEAVRWASRALAHPLAKDVRLNIGAFEGGIKANMIASVCTVRFGVRPPAGSSAADVLDELCALADPARVAWTRGYTAPALPAPGRSPARALAAKLGVDEGEPVDFFTEAALFCEAGAHAVVFGPGDIARAHTAGEWVAVDDVERATAAFTRIFSGGSA